MANADSDIEPALTMTAVGVRTVLSIFMRWGVTDVEASILLGGISVSAIRSERLDDVAGKTQRDLLDRLSLILGIYKSLQILFDDAAQADSWLRRQNAAPLFQGASAMELMLSGDIGSLESVRRYLATQDE